MSKQQHRFSRTAGVLVVVTTMVIGLVAVAQQPAAARTRPELLVSTQWLADHLSDPKLVLVHVGDADAYKTAHLPGARLLTTDKIATQHEMPHVELLPDDQLKANLEAIGISNDSRVVIYSPDWDPYATRLYFTLDYLGVADHAALLDGGIEKWNLEKRPTSTDAATVTKGLLTIHPHPEIVAKMAAVQQLTSGSDSSTVLIDARPIKRYRAGHLPGAAPFFWEKNLVSAEDPVLKSPEELRKMYAAAGATPGKKIVSYCEVGLQASYAYFIARYLGYDAAMYDGSYMEWSTAKQPSVRGDSPR
jgi:thiosulfate/3-mercaptopyruvate sulfurtransferase